MSRNDYQPHKFQPILITCPFVVVNRNRGKSSWGLHNAHIFSIRLRSGDFDGRSYVLLGRSSFPLDNTRNKSSIGICKNIEMMVNRFVIGKFITRVLFTAWYYRGTHVTGVCTNHTINVRNVSGLYYEPLNDSEMKNEPTNLCQQSPSIR